MTEAGAVAGAVITEAQLQALVGRRFPGGRVRLEPYVDWLLRDVVGAPQRADDPDAPDGQDPADAPDAVAHPLVAFPAAQGGIGVELEEVFALFGACSADGPMLGEWAVDVTEPLRTGREYEVRGAVHSVERKRGGSTGVFDLATVAIELVGPDGCVHAEVRPTYVFPRRGT